MSFSSEIKDEVAKIKVDDYKIILSELAGITPMCGILNFKNNKISKLWYFLRSVLPKC